MMKTSAKILAVMSACAMCAVMAGGAAYAIAPSVEQAEAQVAAEAAKAEADEAFSEAYASSANLLELSGVDENGNNISFASGSPAIIGADQHTAVIEDSGAEALTPMSLEIFGNVISYVDALNATTAPTTTGGLWKGSDSTTDGSWGYFIGHHPGVFNSVMYLADGDQVTVCDRDGNTATYTVFAVYDVDDSTTWDEIASNITNSGESITLQTCVGDGDTYRIVQAA